MRSRLHIWKPSRLSSIRNYCALLKWRRRRTKLNRSALIREAIRAHLKSHYDIRERELRDRKGYEGNPTESEELSGWEAEAIWPKE